MNFQSRHRLVSLPIIVVLAIIAMTSAHLHAQAVDRSVLPIPDPSYPPIAELDARKATPPRRFEVKAPSGAPNVLIILLDDMGFGQPSTFGGPINMPTLDRLAKGGLRYNEFHVTALCSPTRAALLKQLLFVRRQGVPVFDCLWLRRQLRARWNDAQLLLPRERFLTQLIPS